MCGLLYFYGLHLHDMTSKGILYIATFITQCEALLGIEPNFALLSWLFQMVLSFPGVGLSGDGGCPDPSATACC
jgi:hypothetical protein